MYQFVFILSCFLITGRQQKTVSVENSFIGTWHGSSICADPQKDRACKDEEVVYVVKEINSVPDTVEMEAFKIINGKRVSMGLLRPGYSRNSNLWRYELDTRVHAEWSFQVNGSKLIGTLKELPSRRLIRNVNASRINN